MHAKEGRGKDKWGKFVKPPLFPSLSGVFFLGRKFWHATLDLMGILLQGMEKKTKKEFMVIGSCLLLAVVHKRDTRRFPVSPPPTPIFLFPPVLISLRSRARENEVSWPVVDPIYRSNINHWSAVGWGKRLRRTEGGILKFPNCRHSLLFPGFLF